ncbi:MAG: polysaccharide deacetylase [Lachnospiraceae bacterium]|nr:polysaccharide deacetylase [Lachnospiraceae bacterium]
MRTNEQRRRRVNRLKKMIVTLVILCLLIPTVLSSILLIRVTNLQTQVTRLEERITQLEQGQITDLISAVQSDEAQTVSGEVADPGNLTEDEEGAGSDIAADGEYAASDSDGTAFQDTDAQVRKVYLTFDDGPSYQTDRILDILELYDVKATFFVVGKEEEHYSLLYQRIVKEGHSLGMHSYSHQYATLYASTESFTSDLDKIQDFLYDKTGVTSLLYRFPGGSSNSVITKENLNLDIAILQDRGIRYFDWNVSSGDASGATLSAAQIKENVISGIKRQSGDVVVLMHDADDKKTTIEALPQIIEEIQAMENVELCAITDETETVQHYTYEASNE